MPASTSTSTSASPSYSLFQERLIVTLLPYFLPFTSNFELARAEIVETLESYGARTRAEMIAAARIIALSFGALDLLAGARGDDMPYTLRLRACGYANNLERSCQQEERALAKRLAADPPGTDRPELPAELTDGEMEVAFEQARPQIESYRTARPSDAHPAAGRHAFPASGRDRPWTDARQNPVVRTATPPGMSRIPASA